MFLYRRETSGENTKCGETEQAIEARLIWWGFLFVFCFFPTILRCHWKGGRKSFLPSASMKDRSRATPRTASAGESLVRMLGLGLRAHSHMKRSEAAVIQVAAAAAASRRIRSWRSVRPRHVLAIGAALQEHLAVAGRWAAAGPPERRRRRKRWIPGREARAAQQMETAGDRSCQRADASGAARLSRVGRGSVPRAT